MYTQYMDPPDMWNECDFHRHDTFLAILVRELTVSRRSIH